MKAAHRCLWATLLVALLVASGQAHAAWIDIDYGPLLDRRQPTHSGESIGAVLKRLDGRGVPTAGERPADRTDHALLDPFLETYAFVLADALDARQAQGPHPFVDVGDLWPSGAPRPGWADLLRARRYVVQSDGRGRVRAFLPVEQGGDDAGTSARQAWTAAWPLMRQVLAALSARVGGGAEGLQVEVRAYVAEPARTRFRLGDPAFSTQVSDLRGDGTRPPLDLEAWQRFLDQGLRLEGARLEADGSIRLFGSPEPGGWKLMGRPVALSDFAVAYRAIFHGGLAEPYMSLDRGFSPQTAIVNYGGRLNDTALGWVSLLCDVRFKTFSMGIDIASGRDIRDEVRKTVPDFATHMERFSRDPASVDVSGQQTRLWFYPDAVDLTVSAQSDVLVLRRVRMSAASERVEVGGAASGEAEAPWTRQTVASIDTEYDGLMQLFPEMADLDQVVRLLSLFSWLKQVEAQGRLLPELDALLAVELPLEPTPPTYPQLLAFNALPQQGGAGRVDVFDRVDVSEALDRIQSPLRPLPAQQRLQRAASMLDPEDAEASRLRQEIESRNPSSLDDESLDFLAYRAERLRMHRLVLGSLPQADRGRLIERQQSGDRVRVFSVGIGGLDLDMGRALDRASGSSMSLAGFGAVAASRQVAAADSTALRRTGETREVWRAAPQATAAPAHGEGISGSVVAFARGKDGERAWLDVAAGAGRDYRSRRSWFDGQGRVTQVVRHEGGRRLHYKVDNAAGNVGLVLQETSSSAADAPRLSGPPSGLGLLSVAPASPSAVRVRLVGSAQELEADFPRALMQRVVLGPKLVLDPRRSPISAFAPLPAALGPVETLLVMAAPSDDGPGSTAGEEDPIWLAHGLNAWWRDGNPAPSRAAVATAGSDSVLRWQRARPVGGGLLWLPEGAFGQATQAYAAAARQGWGGSTVERLPQRVDADLVVLVSGEGPAALLRRAEQAARDPRLEGKALLIWPLFDPDDPAAPARLLAPGNLATVGMALPGVVAQREVGQALGQLAAALRGDGRRPERLDGPFVWFY